ncbi:MAG: DUF1697 domain-containing protein [Chloroflexota bacterium]
MTKYIAFLRAINVGGTKIIKMDDLRKMFESFGFDNVQTYIQSGNVIFESKDTPNLEAKLEDQLALALGYRVEIFLRTMDEISKIVKQTRFEPKEADTLHIVFLRGKPAKSLADKLKQYNSAADEFAVNGREVYNLRHDRDKSVFSNSFVEKIFGTATTRNITTLRKIFEKYR